ncbi:polysaccharide export protein [Polaribacter sp. WD7]|uniref:polysaccharide biosynthesis/export family protein n=1 Tax=Polaribacter sp. WD7 TaxID=2269061 RepID=UPI000DF2A8DD|nr:polysaccharide biosynthesis/export family protein [Polaribacter sp. WD7]RCS27687.1 polysaccharide export protein [Polaribacter sp. WD7]
MLFSQKKKIMSIFYRVIFSFLFLITITSCVSNKKIAYLQNDTINQKKVSNIYTTIFKPDDLLQITVIADDIKAAIPFNLPTVSVNITAPDRIGQERQLIPYLVDSKGNIDFPVLGSIKVAGKTREEVISLLKSKLSPRFLKNPTINIRITNFKVNIFGDVRRPGAYTIPNERVTILDALSLAGDLNISGRRDNILVTREEGDEKKEYRIDLRSKNIYTSPVFYLQQNDNIYVEHNYARIQSASNNSNRSLFISITGLLITIVSLLIR